MFSVQTNQRGFTLVELAIVMIIIGLLLGGVIKGQELIQNAQISSLASTAKDYEAAYHTFTDRYAAMPGDMRNAAARIPGCSTSAVCVDAGGNGDGTLGVVATNWSRNDQSTITSEPTQFWVHMGLADMVDGLSLENSQTWGAVYPASKLGGGFQALQANQNVNNSGASDYSYARGVYVILRLPPTGDAHPNNLGEAVLNPGQYAMIERKIDDEIPNDGRVISDNAGNLCWDGPTGVIQESEKQTICLTGFKIK
jgi:prepilin-type N-terminal cleavage/methylation domain-containing protein